MNLSFEQLRTLLAAAEHGYSQEDLLKYIIAYSMHRQKNLRQYGTWLI